MILNKTIKQNKRIGIWGFGVMGKSAVEYLSNQGYQLGVLDTRTPNQEELHYLKEKKIHWYTQDQQELFFNSYEIIIPSSGININPQHYATHKNKWLHELDYFNFIFNKPIIAITGSIGKTSTTYILNQICQNASLSVAMGGNIGIPTFDLIINKDAVDYALLEVSSFQLSYNQSFAPFLSVWTNFYPNHLDHHLTEQEYFLAKNNILRYQTKDQFSLIPFNLRNKVSPCIPGHQRSYFIADRPNNSQLNILNENEQLYYIDYHHTVIRYKQGLHIPIMTITPTLLSFSFIDNILLLTAICDILKINPAIFQTIASILTLPAHRIEKIASINSVNFYNDSKSTTTASTLAAVKKLSNRPLHLFLGGLSKGVDRAPFIAQLKNHVKYIYCFGKESVLLHSLCISHNIPSKNFYALNDAITECMANIQPEDHVLLSPAGSSYDLYQNYEERGQHFKKLVAQYTKNNIL